MPSRSPISTGPSRCFQRRCTILRTTGAGVLFGWRCGREDRSTIPAGPSPGTGPPTSPRSSTTRHSAPRPGPPASRINDQTSQPQPGTRSQSSVGMGSVGHEDLLVVERFLDSSTPHREVFTRPRPQIVSSHDLDQRLWASQLARSTERARLRARSRARAARSAGSTRSAPSSTRPPARAARCPVVSESESPTPAGTTLGGAEAPSTRTTGRAPWTSRRASIVTDSSAARAIDQ